MMFFCIRNKCFSLNFDALIYILYLYKTKNSKYNKSFKSFYKIVFQIQSFGSSNEVKMCFYKFMSTYIIFILRFYKSS